MGVDLFFTQVFEHNFFHADMHPGNIFVTDEQKYAVVDFGIMGTLNQNDLHFLALSFQAFFNRDYKGVVKAHFDANWISEDIEPIEFENSIRSVCEPVFSKPLKDISFGRILLDLFKEFKKLNIDVKPQLFLLDKTLLNIESLGKSLYPELDLWTTAKPFFNNLIKKKSSSKYMFKKSF